MDDNATTASRRRIRLGDLTFDVLLAGPEDGVPVVLLHGFPQTAEAWTEQLDRLAHAGHRVIAPNQRGYSPGARPTSVRDYRMRHLLTDVERLADALGIGTYHLVGHDWGGVVAWYAAMRRPERLRTVTSVSTPHPAAFAAALRHRDQRRRSSYVTLFRSRLGDRVLPGPRGAGLRALFASTGLPPGPRRRYLDAARRDPGFVRAGLNWYRANPLANDLDPPPVTVPTLFVWGMDDPAAGPFAARATGRFVTGPYRFVALRGVGHWVPEAAAQRLLPPLLEHLSTVEAPPS